MRILLKKNNHLLRSLSSISSRKWSTSCSPLRVNSPSFYFPQCQSQTRKTTEFTGEFALLKQHFDHSSKYEFAVLSPENLSSQNCCSFENPWLERYAEFAPACNGLLYVYNKSGDAAVWNPSTEESIELPCHRKPETTIVDAGAFGYDSKSRDYKVVRFVDSCIGFEEEKEGIDCRIGVELYSFKSNSWKWISEDAVFDFCSPSTYVNGCSYWLCKDFILKFDFADECFSCIDLPHTGKILDGISFALDLVEFDGSLGAVVYPKFGTGVPRHYNYRMSFEVWATTGVWSKLVNIPPCTVRRPMGLWRNSHFFFEGMCGVLLVYDLYTNEFTEHVIRCTSGNDGYSPSLQSINSGGGMRSIHEFIPYVETMLPMEDQLQVTAKNIQSFKTCMPK